MTDAGPVRPSHPVVDALELHRVTRPEPGQQLEMLVEHVSANLRVGLFTAVVPFERTSTSSAPKISRPPDNRSREAVCRATTSGRRRGNGVTRVPKRMLLVPQAAAVRPIQRVDHVNGTRGKREHVIPDEEPGPACPLGLCGPTADQPSVHPDAEARH